MREIIFTEAALSDRKAATSVPKKNIRKEMKLLYSKIWEYITDLLHFFCKSNPPYLMTHLPIKELPITTTFLSLATSAILLASLTDLN